MSPAAAMATSTAQPWQRWKAGLAGFFYVLVMVAAAITFFVDGRVIVHGDAAATAANVLAHQRLLLLNIGANLVAAGFSIAVTFLFYELLKAVDSRISFVAAFLCVEACLIDALGSVLHLVPLVVVKSAQWLSVLDVRTLHTLVLRLLELNTQAASTGMLIFGLYSLLIGYLVFKSPFHSRVLGIMTVTAGVSWIAGSLVYFLSVHIANLVAA